MVRAAVGVAVIVVPTVGVAVMVIATVGVAVIVVPAVGVAVRATMLVTMRVAHVGVNECNWRRAVRTDTGMKNKRTVILFGVMHVILSLLFQVVVVLRKELNKRRHHRATRNVSPCHTETASEQNEV